MSKSLWLRGSLRMRSTKAQEPETKRGSAPAGFPLERRILHSFGMSQTVGDSATGLTLLCPFRSPPPQRKRAAAPRHPARPPRSPPAPENQQQPPRRAGENQPHLSPPVPSPGAALTPKTSGLGQRDPNQEPIQDLNQDLNQDPGGFARNQLGWMLPVKCFKE